MNTCRTTVKGWRSPFPDLAALQRFTTGGAMRGEPGRWAHAFGWLQGGWRDRFERETPDYVIFSYGTPIAWHHSHGWTVPDTTYSVTTGSHQSRAMHFLHESGFRQRNPRSADWVAGMTTTPDTGSYHPFAIMRDMGTLCEHCANDPSNPVIGPHDGPDIDPADAQWTVAGWSHSGETDETEMCDHCGRMIVEGVPA